MMDALDVLKKEIETRKATRRTIAVAIRKELLALAGHAVTCESEASTGVMLRTLEKTHLANDEIRRLKLCGDKVTAEIDALVSAHDIVERKCERADAREVEQTWIDAAPDDEERNKRKRERLVKKLAELEAELA